MLGVNGSLELRDKIDVIENVCEAEYRGSTVYKDIMILVGNAFVKANSLISFV